MKTSCPNRDCRELLPVLVTNEVKTQILTLTEMLREHSDGHVCIRALRISATVYCTKCKYENAITAVPADECHAAEKIVELVYAENSFQTDHLRVRSPLLVLNVKCPAPGCQQPIRWDLGYKKVVHLKQNKGSYLPLSCKECQTSLAVGKCSGCGKIEVIQKSSTKLTDFRCSSCRQNTIDENQYGIHFNAYPDPTANKKSKHIERDDVTLLATDFEQRISALQQTCSTFQSALNRNNELLHKLTESVNKALEKMGSGSQSESANDDVNHILEDLRNKVDSIGKSVAASGRVVKEEIEAYSSRELAKDELKLKLDELEKKVHGISKVLTAGASSTDSGDEIAEPWGNLIDGVCSRIESAFNKEDTTAALVDAIRRSMNEDPEDWRNLLDIYEPHNDVVADVEEKVIGLIGGEALRSTLSASLGPILENGLKPYLEKHHSSLNEILTTVAGTVTKLESDAAQSRTADANGSDESVWVDVGDMIRAKVGDDVAKMLSALGQLFHLLQSQVLNKLPPGNEKLARDYEDFLKRWLLKNGIKRIPETVGESGESFEFDQHVHAMETAETDEESRHMKIKDVINHGYIWRRKDNSEIVLQKARVVVWEVKD